MYMFLRVIKFNKLARSSLFLNTDLKDQHDYKLRLIIAAAKLKRTFGCLYAPIDKAVCEEPKGEIRMGD